jgi:hypothetical protein
MKRYTALPLSILYLLVFLSIVCGSIACKKNSPQRHSPFDGKFSFRYNGTNYTLPFKEGTTEWSVTPGIYINRADIFNGIIHFPTSSCAYMDTGTSGENVTDIGNCHLTQISGAPIDSAVVYLYLNGFFNINYYNCESHSEYDVFTGRTINYDVCDANGTFELTLKNKDDNIIRITEGSFQQYNLRR